MTAVQTLAQPMQLDPEFRQQWLDALRSPEWAGHETYVDLHKGQDRFCALGLALKINDVPFYGQPEEDEPPVSYTWLRRKGVNVSRCWMVFDATDEDGDYLMTFAQFADWLEANSEPAQ